jgi:hypothetical protein
MIQLFHARILWLGILERVLTGSSKVVDLPDLSKTEAATAPPSKDDRR